MREWITAFFMAWGMFLAIPCPCKRWDERARQKMLVCLPLITELLSVVRSLFTGDV